MEVLGSFVSIRPVRAMLALAVLLVASNLHAADKVALISLKPTKQLLADSEYLLKAVGMQQLGQMILPQAQMYLQNIDGKLPIGIVLTIDQGQFTPLAFLPVTNLQTFLRQIEGQVGEPLDAGDGVLELQGPQPVFVKQQGGWAFVGQSKSSLSELPADPAKLLEGLDQSYDISVRAYVKNVPEPFKQMAIGQVRQGLQQGLAENDDPTAKQMADAQVAQLTRLIQEADALTLGLQISPQNKRVHMDVTLKAIAGTDMAKQVAAAKDTHTRYSGFLVSDAAIQANMASRLLPEQIEEAVLNLDRFEKQTADQLENDDDLDSRTRAAAKELVKTFFKLARSTVKTGEFDTCSSVILKPKAMTLISAGHVADGSEVESAVKQLVAMAQNESDFSFSSVKLNAAEHAGVRFHTLGVPLPDDENARKILGDNLEITVGVAEQSAYLALGSDGINLLKQAIDASNGTQPTVEPFHLEVSLLSVLKFAQSVEENPIIDAMIQLVGTDAALDHVRVRTSVEDDTILYRVEMEEGVLRLLGQAGQMWGAGAGF